MLRVLLCAISVVIHAAGSGYTDEGLVRWSDQGGIHPVSRRVPWYDSIRAGLIYLNENGHNEGVTPINGCLKLNHVDLVVTGRGLNLQIARTYSSKIWCYVSAKTERFVVFA